jgi:hypothetical protein
MVDLKFIPPILPALRPKATTGNFIHIFNDLNAKEKASWHAYQV